MSIALYTRVAINVTALCYSMRLNNVAYVLLSSINRYSSGHTRMIRIDV